MGSAKRHRGVAGRSSWNLGRRVRLFMLCQLGPRGASSDAGAQRTTRDKYDASVGCSAAKGPGRLRDDRLFSSDDITILVHGKWGFATTGVAFTRLIDEEREDARSLGAQVGLPSKFRDEGIPGVRGGLDFPPPGRVLPFGHLGHVRTARHPAPRAGRCCR